MTKDDRPDLSRSAYVRMLNNLARKAQGEANACAGVDDLSDAYYQGRRDGLLAARDILTEDRDRG